VLAIGHPSISVLVHRRARGTGSMRQPEWCRPILADHHPVRRINPRHSSAIGTRHVDEWELRWKICFELELAVGSRCGSFQTVQHTFIEIGNGCVDLYI